MKKKLTIIVMTVFLLGGIIFAAETVKLDKTKEDKKLKEEEYKNKLKTITCDTFSYQLVDLKVKPECNLADECTYRYGFYINGIYAEDTLTKSYSEFANMSKAQIFGELNELFQKRQFEGCGNEKEKLKKEYKYEIDLK